jgi:hypothetical protein
MSDSKGSGADVRPKYDLETYRKFIRDAAPYVSLIAGRRIHPSQADLMPENELIRLALLIDQRVGDLDKQNP